MTLYINTKKTKKSPNWDAKKTEWQIWTTNWQHENKNLILTHYQCKGFYTINERYDSRAMVPCLKTIKARKGSVVSYQKDTGIVIDNEKSFALIRDHLNSQNNKFPEKASE